MRSDPAASSTSPVFMGWDRPALHSVARILAEEYVGPDGLDMRGAVVVTPAARAGRRLLELLLEEAEVRGIPFTPPVTVTIGRLPELLYEGTGLRADATAARHAFLQVLQEADADELAGVFPHLPSNLPGWMALAGIVEKLHRELGGEDLGFAAVAREFRTGLPYDDSDRWEVLAEIQARYLKVLDGAGLRDRDRERRRAIREDRLCSPGEIWLVGVVELPRLVRQMLANLPGSVRSLVHAPEEIRARFDSFGCVVPEMWGRAAIGIDEDSIRVVQRPRDQAVAVVEGLRGFGGRFGEEEVVVGVPDSELVPFLERALSDVGVKHRFAGGTPLEETGPVRVLKGLGEYLNGRPYSSFAALIRHPDLHGMAEGALGGEGADALTTLDRYQSWHLQDHLGPSLPGEKREDQRARRLVRNLEDALGLERLRGSGRLSEWMPLLLETLARVYGGRPMDRTSLRVRKLVASLDHIKTAATRLANLPRSLDREMGASDALAMLVAELAGPDLAIPPDPEERAVELLGWLELPMDDAPALVLTGVNERILPEAMGADPFLPGGLRTRLGIPDDAARYARDAYLLSAMVNSREEIHLVAGRISGGGDPLRPSRLLFATGEGPEGTMKVARRVRRYLGEGDGEDGARVEAEDPEADSVPEDVSSFRSPPQETLPPPDSLSEIRVTDFAAYLADPYRFALTRVLGLDALDDDAREMDGAVFGTLAHDVLEKFGKLEASAPSDLRVMEGRLEQLLDQEVGRRFGARPLPAVRVQVEQLRARLRRFARWQAEWAGRGWRVICAEANAGKGFPLDVDGVPVLLKGKIDRIDHNPETGEWAVFDYKTSEKGDDPEKTHRRKKGGELEWVDLQLPLYRALLPVIRREDGSPVVPESSWASVRLGYILLPRKLDGTREALADWTEADFASAMETARQVIRDLRSKESRFDPGLKGYFDDPFDALLGRLELPKADEEDGEGGEE